VLAWRLQTSPELHRRVVIFFPILWDYGLYAFGFKNGSAHALDIIDGIAFVLTNGEQFQCNRGCCFLNESSASLHFF